MRRRGIRCHSLRGNACGFFSGLLVLLLRVLPRCQRRGRLRRLLRQLLRSFLRVRVIKLLELEFAKEKNPEDGSALNEFSLTARIVDGKSKTTLVVKSVPIEKRN